MTVKGRLPGTDGTSRTIVRTGATETAGLVSELQQLPDYYSPEWHSNRSSIAENQSQNPDQ